MCCKAMTASCLSCSAGVTEEEYCGWHPETVVCPDDVDCDVCHSENLAKGTYCATPAGTCVKWNKQCAARGGVQCGLRTKFTCDGGFSKTHKGVTMAECKALKASSGFEHALYFKHKKAEKRACKLCDARATTKKGGKKWIGLAAAKTPEASAGAEGSMPHLYAVVIPAAVAGFAAAVAGCIIAMRRRAQRAAEDSSVGDAAAPLSPLTGEKHEIDV